MTRVLVTGGAGYIGSIAVRRLLEQGHEPVVFDCLDRGHRDNVPPEVPFVLGDVRDTAWLTETLRASRIDAIMHFAALAYVGESVERPLAYYHANTAGSASLLVAMQQAGVSRLVFSSSCATYGVPDALPIVEDTPQRPINPYGASKLFVERMLADASVAWPELSWVAFRYFNVCGASQDGTLGERHDPETHIVPLAIAAARGGDPLTILGDDWPTPDGTCIRDYLHVEDVCAAHVIALDHLREGFGRVYNLGLGHGTSVLELLAAVERVVGRPVPRRVGARRPGDPAELWASAERARQELGWEPRWRDLDAMVDSAARWHAGL
ncbi:MAG: UDP-glucose 4-epimerase GalE [Myxococcales bacterium]